MRSPGRMAAALVARKAARISQSINWWHLVISNQSTAKGQALGVFLLSCGLRCSSKGSHQVRHFPQPIRYPSGHGGRHPSRSVTPAAMASVTRSHRQTLPCATVSFITISTDAPQGAANLLRKRIPLPEISSMLADMTGPGLIPNTLTVAIWFGLDRPSLRCCTLSAIGRKT
jgi:hypothetical protein